MRKLSLIVILATCFLLLLPLAANAAIEDNTTDTIYHIGWLQPDLLETKLDNGIDIRYTTLFLATGDGNIENYYRQKTKALFFSYSNNILITGIKVDITNNSDQFQVIKTSESCLSIGNFAGIPLLPGTKYTEAGNPSATPDILLPPKTVIHQEMQISRAVFSGGEWCIEGECIPKTDSLDINLYLKIVDQQGKFKYYNAKSPKIGLKRATA